MPHCVAWTSTAKGDEPEAVAHRELVEVLAGLLGADVAPAQAPAADDRARRGHRRPAEKPAKGRSAGARQPASASW